MERRLKLAKKLLNPKDSVLIVTIDEKEYLRLGILLEQTFPECKIQMVSTVIAPQGSSRGSMFKRSDEYIFVVFIGGSKVAPLPLSPEWGQISGTTVRGSIHWASLKRTGTGATRVDREQMFYPVFLNSDCASLHSVGEFIPLGEDKDSVVPPEETVAIWPIRRDGSEGRWQVGPSTLRALFAGGHARLGQPKGEDTAIAYLKSGERQKVLDGTYQVTGHRQDGSIITSEEQEDENPLSVPTTVWNLASHSAGHHGSNILRSLIPGRKFPFPKSLYAVEDTLRFFIANKPNALVLDFFGGSGTTTHAVMRLNRQDNGTRRSILVTNNAVSDDEDKQLQKAGFQPGDPDYEALGIFEYITKPRITAALTGKTPEGAAIKGEYKFFDGSPFSEGFEENVEFFKLTYEDNQLVRLGRKFNAIAPILWMRAGAQGERIDDLPEAGWCVPEAAYYGILTDVDQWESFIEAVNARGDIRCVFIVTDSQAEFEAINVQIDQRIDSVRLYSDYLQTFEINTRQG